MRFGAVYDKASTCTAHRGACTVLPSDFDVCVKCRMHPSPNAPHASPRPLTEGHRFVDVVELMNRLLAPDGCPWDREQTLASLKPYLLEEAHEVLEALESGDVQHHREELGDLLLQIVFQSALREREGAFDIDQVCTALVDKMKRRHPHVYGELVVKDAQEVLSNWGAIKAAEKKAQGPSEKRGTLAGIPTGLPALLRAQRLGERAAAVGFDWPDLTGVRDKLNEELAELNEALGDGDDAAIVHELGDVLFTLTRLCSKLGHPPEDVLRAANARFVQRFSAMEQAAESDGHTLKELSLSQMNAYWDRGKTSAR